MKVWVILDPQWVNGVPYCAKYPALPFNVASVFSNPIGYRKSHILVEFLAYRYWIGTTTTVAADMYVCTNELCYDAVFSDSV